MPVRHIYLKIEQIDDYSPVEPQKKTPPTIKYKRDGLRNMGHPNGMISDAERDARAMTAVVYREYLDPHYLIPNTDKLIDADVNEPVFNRRVPGAILYAYLGEQLHIHVLNMDVIPHSFHIHGLEYGIDSDGAWPLGTEATDGRRSDEICPGDTWTYILDVKPDSIGVWPFHDHARQPAASIDRGLFGGLVILPKRAKGPPLPKAAEPLLGLEKLVKKAAAGRLARVEALPRGARAIVRARHEFLHEWLIRDRILKYPPFVRGTIVAPVFFHQMSDPGQPLFDSGELHEGGDTYSHTFQDEGTYGYFCTIHPMMQGTVEVVVESPPAPDVQAVNILGPPNMGFSPDTVKIRPGGTVTWTNQDPQQHHTVTSKDGASQPTHCINGRGFFGNSPTIVAKAGQKIRWYVFNMDLGHNWHNFHTHAMRWQFAGENIDVRSMGPAESFIVETSAPPVMLLPDHMAKRQAKDKRPRGARRYTLRGDYIFHCHVHHHLMNGMVGVVRSYQTVWLTRAMKQELKETRGLPLDDGKNSIPDVDEERCKKHGTGHWELIPGDPEVTFMHSCLLPKTGKVLYWGYTRIDQSRLFDPATGTILQPSNQPASLPGETAASSDLWSAEHAFLDDADGTLLVHGGLTDGPNPGAGPIRAYLFDPNPAAESWSHTAFTAHKRFYSTTLTLSDGRVLTMYGSNGGYTVSPTIEVYNPPPVGTWDPPISFPTSFNYLFYPWAYLLPDGRIFIAGPESPTRRFVWTAPVDDPNETFATNAGTRSTSGQDGTSVLLTLRPPGYEPKVLIIGGRNPGGLMKSTETIDLSVANPAWQSEADMLHGRENCTSVLMPDGRVFVAGGIPGGADGGPCEIFDPADPAKGWEVGPTMAHVRGYHSSMILLADGSIMVGGDPSSFQHERYFPGYFSAPRPEITNAPASANYGAAFDVDTPQAGIISEVVLMRAGAVTHGFNMSQRAIECTILGPTGGGISVEAPHDANHAPPGWYLLFVLDVNRVPSEGRWIRLTT